MKAPAFPENEPSRLQALQDLDILYSPAEERFDRITRVARRVFDVPIALVSLVGKDNQWFKSCQGLTVSETSREVSFCGHAILNDDVFVVPNTLKDPDFKDNPLVTNDPKIRFYAGQPLTHENQRIGTLCLIDQRPRQLRPQDYDSLKCLAAWVEIELRAWKQGQNSELEQVLRLERREALLDPVTGDLNDEGIEILRKKLNKLEREQESALQISLKITNIPKGLPQDSIDLLRMSVAQSIRAIVSDRGIIGQQGIDGFVILFASSSRESVTKVMRELEKKLTNFIDSEFELTFIKPIIKMQLETVEADD